ncbi:hypothetical protein B4N84_10790 [Flavobacterium sp. IR1]|nr:hypothetical protein B4N84_10790 [Flavobacterium sp. IR1]
MKKIYILVVLLFSFFSFGQAPIGQYKVVFKGWARGDKKHHCGEAYVDLEFNNSSHNYRGLEFTYSKNSPRKDYDTTTYFSAAKRLTSMYFYSSRQVKSSCNGHRPHNSGRIKDRDRFHCFNYDFQFNQFTNVTHDDIGLWNSSFNVKVSPVLTIFDDPNEEKYLSVEGDKTISSHIGFDNQEYNWQYALVPVRGSKVWVNLREYNTLSSITTTASKVLKTNANAYHGKKIFFRQVACNGTVTSNVLEYEIAVETPKILSVSPSLVKCYDSTKDGKIKIQFERPLLAGEELNITLTSGGTSTNFLNVTLNRDASYDISGLDPGQYDLQLNGSYTGGDGGVTYSRTATKPVKFKIKKPLPVDYSLISQRNVYCNRGNDGIMTISASGGAGGYEYTIDNGINWIAFTNGTNHIVRDLVKGTYAIKVRDINHCVAKDQVMVGGEIQLGNEKVINCTITEPATPVSIYSSSTIQPTFYGGTNGSITASIIGGTPINGNTYGYEWRNSKNVVISNTKTTTQFGGGLYAITLQDIPADTYTLTVWDANHAAAAHKEGCTIIPVNIILKQPDPIVATLSIQKTISCNVTNQFGNETDLNPYDKQRDESQDGILTVNVIGGVPFTGFSNGGLPYKYFWKKQQKDGSWITINNQDATIEYLSHGNYSVNVEDKNGIRLGNYVSNVLVAERDSIQFMKQPDKLELTFTKEDVFCSQGNNGWAKTHVTGGTAPYKYQWSSGETTADLAGLNTGNYFVQITDTKGCVVQGSILIEQPNGVVVNEKIKNPTCFEGNDGAITLAPTGGVQPYQYRWSTGANTQSLSNLTAGKYTITLTDAQGCILIQDFELTDPAPVVIDLGPDRTLCYQQVLELDASIPGIAPRYEWTSTNGFTSDQAKVSLTKAGNYHVKVSSDLGCIGEDDIVVSVNNTIINSELLLSTQAYQDEEVVLVNTSSPRGETTKWITPEGVTILDKKDNFIALKFNDLGTYTISLQQTQGECYATCTKSIMVEKRSILPNSAAAETSLINDFIVTPNPSDGKFKVLVNLENVSPVNLRLFAANGQNSLIQKKETGKKDYEIDFNTTLASGIYILVLETGQQTLVKKIIVY